MLSHPIISHPIHMTNSYHGDSSLNVEKTSHSDGWFPTYWRSGENFDPQTPSLNSIPWVSWLPGSVTSERPHENPWWKPPWIPSMDPSDFHQKLKDIDGISNYKPSILGIGDPPFMKKNTSSHEALRWHVPCCRFSVGTSTCAAGCRGETRSGKGLVMVKNRMRKVKTTILLVDESPKKKLLAHFWCGFFIPSFVLCSFCALKTNFLQFCSLCWARQTRDFWWLKTLFFAKFGFTHGHTGRYTQTVLLVYVALYFHTIVGFTPRLPLH